MRAATAETTSPTDVGRSSTRRRRRWPGRLLVVLVVLAGVVVTSWPIGSTVVHNYQRTRTAVAVERDTARAVPASVRAELARARQYNDALEPETLRDPWTERGAAGRADQASYLGQLDLFSAMGTLAIPKIRVRLPIHHNATTETMANGVGHFFGTSLPIGGPGTHAVLAGHTGMSYATLFDRLPELRVGDRFTVRVYGEVLTYQVDHITKVLPDQFDEVARVPGQDYVTLLTCTPRLVNTHRLLVRGVRIPGSPSGRTETTTTTTSTTENTDLTVQRWMVPRLALSIAALVILALILVGWIMGDRRRARARRFAGGLASGRDGDVDAPRGRR